MLSTVWLKVDVLTFPPTSLDSWEKFSEALCLYSPNSCDVTIFSPLVPMMPLIFVNCCVAACDDCTYSAWNCVYWLSRYCVFSAIDMRVSAKMISRHVPRRLHQNGMRSVWLTLLP